MQKALIDVGDGTPISASTPMIPCLSLDFYIEIGTWSIHGLKAAGPDCIDSRQRSHIGDVFEGPPQRTTLC
jgi:hypothetical protein